MTYTEEDANSDYKMSIECPLCPICSDTGFIAVPFVNGIRSIPCDNCHVAEPRVVREFGR